MLSSVLNSDRAVQMNILIVRAFVKLRELLVTHKDFARRVDKLEPVSEITPSPSVSWLKMCRAIRFVTDDR